MIEIIPNVHPIFVHFTVGLYSAAAGFYFLAYLTDRLWLVSRTYTTEFEVVARWCLWAAGIITIITVWAGLHAYNTINHDGPSHIAMTSHRNWALPTAGAILLVACWSVWRHYKRRAVTFTFLLAMLIVQGLLLSTAWRGAELVFRYGLGVMSMPKSEGEGHHHHDMPMEMNGGEMDHATMPPMSSDAHSDHHGHAE